MSLRFEPGLKPFRESEATRTANWTSSFGLAKCGTETETGSSVPVQTQFGWFETKLW